MVDFSNKELRDIGMSKEDVMFRSVNLTQSKITWEESLIDGLSHIGLASGSVRDYFNLVNQYEKS